MRTAFKILLPIAILGAGIAVFVLLKSTKPEEAPPAARERVWRVEVEKAAARRLAPELELYGQVETSDLLGAAASAPAWVAAVGVREGDRVRAGQLLVQLDERDFLPRIAQVEAQIAELQAEIASEKNRLETDRRALEQEQRLLEIAREGVERQRRLMKQKLGAEQTLDEAERAEVTQALAVRIREVSLADHPARLRALEARLANSKARLRELTLELERATVSAPYDGVVTSVEVTAGDQVAKGAVLVRLYAIESLEVRARIPAPYQAELVRAIAAGERLVASAEIGPETIMLALDRLAGEAGPSGVDGLFRVKGDPLLLRPGQLLTLRMARPARVDAFAVPFQAVYGDGRLYKVQAGRLARVDAEVLGSRVMEQGEQRLVVRSGDLRTGDLIVTTHMPNAIDGLRVEILTRADESASDSQALPRATRPGAAAAIEVGP